MTEQTGPKQHCAHFWAQALGLAASTSPIRFTRGGASPVVCSHPVRRLKSARG